MQPHEIKKRFRLLTFGLIGVGLISLATLGLYLFKIVKDVRPTDTKIRIISNMVLSADNQTNIFTPMHQGVEANEIKQIKFSWYQHSSGAWALRAYGVSDSGLQLSRSVDLVIPASVTTVQWLNSERAVNYGDTRGELKYTLNSARLGQDLVIEAYSDITLTPSSGPYPGTTFKYFDLRRTNSTMANPAPPFTFTCVNCDNM